MGNEKTEYRKEQRREKLRQANIDASIKLLLREAEGRDFIWWLLEISKVNHQPFAVNAMTTAFQCGELNVGNQLYHRILETDPDGYLTMLKEINRERQDRDNAVRSANSDGITDYSDGELGESD